jgi:antitoxin (DNA-binding transcriptional repressor) of toxin-antitoxin stability system
VTQATIHQAKTHLSKLIWKALDGEEVIIANRDKPLVRLEPVKTSRKSGRRPLGWATGFGFHMAEDFDEPLEDFEEYMYSDKELAQLRAKRKKRR